MYDLYVSLVLRASRVSQSDRNPVNTSLIVIVLQLTTMPSRGGYMLGDYQKVLL